MAEFVQLRKEKWAGALTNLLQLDILNKNEFKSFLANLDRYEYKIQSQSRKLEDILEYIQFECNVLRLIQERRKHLGQYDLTEEIDRFIYNEIKSQFGSAEINFTHSIDFWNAKLKFIANIVPDHDKESEFELLFKKALSYCGRANLDIYKSCVDYLWTFSRAPPLTVSPRKRRRLNYRRDVSKLMTNIRYFTTEAVRNFPDSPEASVWLLVTELRYLQLLQEENDLYEENPKIVFPYDMDEEVGKSERLIAVIYDKLVKDYSQTSLPFIQLYETLRLLPLAEARSLSKKAYSQIISIKHRTVDVFAWLIGRSIDDNKIDEFLERINQALSSSGSKIKMLEMCIEKIHCFLDKLEVTRDPESCLPRLLQFYTSLIHKDNAEWNVVSSEELHKSRVSFKHPFAFTEVETIKRLPQLIKRLPENCDADIVQSLQTFVEEHNLEKLVKQMVKQFPSSFVLVKERILQILAQEDEDKLKPAVICKNLSGVNWKICTADEALKLLKLVYLAFLTDKKLSKESKLDMFLKLPPTSIPEMNCIRLLHLKKMYLEDVEHGRNFYKSYRMLTSDWNFAYETVKIETTACRNCPEFSDVLQIAQEDAVRLAGTTSTEPWKVCIRSLYKLKKEKDSSLWMERALKKFAANKNNDNGLNLYEDLLLFSKTFHKTL